MHYRISDTGIGMSEEFTKEVFEEFAQEDSDVRTQYHGAGLGMAIVKKYVDMMGGTISVQSKKQSMMKEAGFEDVCVKKDLARNDRVVCGHKHLCLKRSTTQFRILLL